MQAKVFDYEAALKNIPGKPGVYLMKDENATVFYIGKAKDLHKRVRQYFSGNDTRSFVALLHDLLDKIDVIITANEKEALILEATLIKKYKPRFNVLLKDDKEMLQLKLDYSEQWPRLHVVRRRNGEDNCVYFGPYPSAVSCRQSLNLINKFFKIRNCNDTYFKNRVRPCLQYDIHRCPAPCVFDVDRDEYIRQCKQAQLFLEGKYTNLIESISEKMIEASDKWLFEKASEYRDLISAVKHIFEKQQIVQNKAVDQDYFAMKRIGSNALIAVLIVRDGRLKGLKTHKAIDEHSDDKELFEYVVVHHYIQCRSVPPHIILPKDSVEDKKLLEQALADLGKVSPKIEMPAKGSKADLLKTALENAEQQFLTAFPPDAGIDLLTLLRDKFNLDKYPQRIECYDISHLQSLEIVSAMVVAIHGKIDKNRCRKFKIRTTHTQDDYQSMYETLSRRLAYLNQDTLDDPGASEQDRQFAEFPDLIIIDGGKGQLNAALQAVKDARLENRFDIIAMAESRTVNNPFDNEVEHTLERIFVPGNGQSYDLPHGEPLTLFLQMIRNATHDSAVGFNRKRRQMTGLRSRIDEVPGIGPKRKAKLLKAFGSPKALLEHSAEELAQAADMPLATAQKLLDNLMRNDSP